MAPITRQQSQRQKSQPNHGKVQEKAISRPLRQDRNKELPIPIEVLEMIMRTDPQAIRKYRQVCKSWETECKRLASLHRNAVTFPSVRWEVQRKRKGIGMKRSIKIISESRIPEIFQSASINTFGSFLKNYPLLQARGHHITKFHLVLKQFPLSSASRQESVLERISAFCSQITTFVLKDAPNMKDLKILLPLNPSSNMIRDVIDQLGVMLITLATPHVILNLVDQGERPDRTVLRKISANPAAMQLFKVFFDVVIARSPLLEELNLHVTATRRQRESIRIQNQVFSTYLRLAELGQRLRRGDENEIWENEIEPLLGMIRKVPFRGINPLVTFRTGREDFVVQDGSARMWDLPGKAPYLRCVDSFFNDGSKY